MQNSEIGLALSSKPKYVASSTLTNPQWAHTTVLSGDLSAAVGELKEQREGRLLVPGGRTLIRWLIANDLVNEINVFLAPVIIGQGERLFPETGPDTALELAESKVTANGVTIQSYRPNGRPQYGPTTDTTTAWSE
jgi:dihydrofolate reductase